MITRISIMNFKGIGDSKVSFDLRPISLLFGANSAGKSSVVHALHFAREILVNKSLTVEAPETGSDHVDLGAYPNMVHNRDPSKPLVLEIEATVDSISRFEALDLSGHYYPDMIDYSQYLQYPLPEHLRYALDGSSCHRYSAFFTAWNGPYFREKIQTVKVSLEILEEEIVGYEVQINGEAVGQIRLEIDKNGESIAVLQDFNISHPTIPTYFWNPRLAGPLELYHQGANPDFSEDPDNIEHQLLDEGDPENVSGWLERLQAGFIEREKCSVGEYGFYLSLKQFGALPPLNVPCGPSNIFQELNIVDDTNQAYLEAYYAFCLYADVLMCFPGRVIANQLEQMQYLGPMRSVATKAGGKPGTAGKKDVVSSGSAEWQCLEEHDDSLTKAVSDWLSGTHQLAPGYEVRKLEYCELSRKDWEQIENLLRRTDSENSGDETPQPKWKSRVRVVAKKSGIELRLHDVGVGVSQVLPVVIRSLVDKKQFIAIEQPELHLHPKLQAELGDLFIEAALGKRKQQFLLETHSEHLILRILRRIRETTDNELPEGSPPIKPTDVAVYYLESTDDGTKATHLRINEEGEFIDRWPYGFFDERIDELY